MLLLLIASCEDAHSEYLGITVYRFRRPDFDQVAVFMNRVSIFIASGGI